MPNPIINFRLSPYQIARGLWIVRKLEPEYKPVSASQMIKMLYLDYLAKMSIGRSDVLPIELLEEVKTLVSSPKAEKALQLDDIISRQKPTIFDFPTQETSPKEDESIISTVTDFSLPTEWMDDLKEE
jgi:hypothetical protein